jgi:hypothetical protein
VHGGHFRLDVRREGTAYTGGQRLDLGRRRVSRVVPALEGPRISDGKASARLVTFVFQGLHQAGDLLSEAGELRHAAELGCAVNRRRNPQAAENQAHGERQHEHGEQTPRHRPVAQREGMRTKEMKERRCLVGPADVAAAKPGVGSLVVSHCSHPRWLRTLFELLAASSHAVRNRLKTSGRRRDQDALP